MVVEMASDIPARSEKGLTMAKRTLIFVIAPPLIAGFFSILPTIYTTIMRPRAELSYAIVSGPAIPVSNGFRRIFGATIQNTGKVTLTHIDVEINTPNGQIEDVVAEKSLLHPAISLQPFIVTVARMLPTERTNISIMTVSNTSEPTLVINARSDEAVATPISSGEKSSEGEIVLVGVGAILSATSVAVMSLAFIVVVRRRGLASLFGNKPDMITFIAGVSGVIPMTETILVTDHDVTYASTPRP